MLTGKYYFCIQHKHGNEGIRADVGHTKCRQFTPVSCVQFGLGLKIKLMNNMNAGSS